MYKALITDLDGTAVKLASFGEDITDDTIDAVRQAHERGFIIACATGRGWSYAKSVVRKLGITSACIVEGGSRIIDPVSEETVWEEDLTPRGVAFVYEQFKAIAAEALFVSSDKDNLDDQQTDDLGGGQKSIFPTIANSDLPTGRQRYLYALGVDAATAIELCEAINVDADVIAHQTLSWQGENLFDVHVTSSRATKEHAINIWQEIYGVNPEEIIGCGDSGNDMPIFNAVGMKVAVKTATPEIIERADYVAPAPDDGALAHTIHKFLLNGY